jgi:hypothetical protein
MPAVQFQEGVLVTKKRRCVLCGHHVGQGDRHAKLSCPPAALGRDSQRAKRKRLAKRKAKEFKDTTQRGVVVAGTGVPKGASKG